MKIDANHVKSNETQYHNSACILTQHSDFPDFSRALTKTHLVKTAIRLKENKSYSQEKSLRY